MNDATVAELAQNQFATAVRNFTPKLSPKLQKLLPFKDGITELRRKGASYETIADILRDTRSNRPHKVSARTVQHHSSSSPKTHRTRKADSSPSTKRAMQSDKSDTPDFRVARPETAGGPRIADPNTI